MIKIKKILVPRRSSEERQKNHIIAINKKIQEYIKNGSQGELDLEGTPIKQLLSNLVKVGGNLDLEDSKIEKLPDNLTVGGRIYVAFGKEQYFKDKYPQFSNKIR